MWKKIVAVFTALALFAIPLVSFQAFAVTLDDADKASNIIPESGLSLLYLYPDEKKIICNSPFFEGYSENGTHVDLATFVGVFIDARITGEVTLTKCTTSGTGSLNMLLYNCNANQSVSNYTTYYYPNTEWKITYTPSAEDISNGVYFGYTGANGGSIRPSDSDAMGKITSFQKVTQNSTFTGVAYATGSSSKGWSVSYKNFGALILGDIYNYVNTGNFTIDPTSSFSPTSVSKSYGDAAFSACFTTDSDGQFHILHQIRL